MDNASQDAVHPDVDLARSFTRCFRTNDGKKVLDHLQSIAFDRVLTASASEAQLRHQEGQRALVARILRLIDRGRAA